MTSYYWASMNWDEYMSKFEEIPGQQDAYINTTWTWQVLYFIWNGWMIIQIIDNAFSVKYAVENITANDKDAIKIHIINAIADADKNEKKIIKVCKRERARHIGKWLFREFVLD